MRRAVIQRKISGDGGTFGRLSMDGFECETGELPDRQNAPMVSCIPPGIYQCQWTFSPHFGRNLYLVLRVPNRDGIRIHPANWMGNSDKGFKCELDGCIALGKNIKDVDGQPMLVKSHDTVVAFEKLLSGESFELEIRGIAE